MEKPNKVKLYVRIFEFNSEDVADVTIRLVNTKNVIGIYRSNPITLELDPGAYAIYISGDYYDTSVRAFNLLPEQDFKLELPVYLVGTMPGPPRTIRDMPVRTKPMDIPQIIETMSLTLKRSDFREETYDGPAYVEYRNPDGYIFTRKMNVEDEKLISFKVGPVPVQILAWCGNNTWREMGSPGKKR